MKHVEMYYSFAKLTAMTAAISSYERTPANRNGTIQKIEGNRDANLLTDLKRVAKPIRSFIDTLEQEESPLVPLLKADIKIDSETERKPEKMVDISRQNSTNQKPLSRSRSHPSQLLTNNKK